MTTLTPATRSAAQEAPHAREDLPVVTLVTPTYNQADFLAETIESVLKQTYPAIDFVIVDDGSTDHTQEVLGAYAGRIAWKTQSNRGQARTLNDAWDSARGTYLTYLSSDDLLHPQAIERLVDYLESHPSAACVFPDADLIDSTSRVVKRKVCRAFDLEKLIIEQECYIGPGAVWRRAHYQKIGGWRPEMKLSPDRDFWIRMANMGSIDFLPEVLSSYRLHGGSLSYKVVSEEVSIEYIRTLDECFSAGVNPRVEARKQEAYARAHLLIARNCYRGLDIARGNHHYRLARELHPPLGGLGTRMLIARNIISKPVRNGLANLRRLVSGT
jgi:glycosyltransferase involved in cell wall biosynthesis